MKRIGIIGGIAPESTIVYYREIINLYILLMPEFEYPDIVINSINMTKMLSYLPAHDIDGLTEYLLKEINRLVKAQVDIAIIASNTPHLVFDKLKERSPIPLISIVEQTCKKAKELGIKRAGLIGTKFTMKNNFYQDVFIRENISLVVPNEEEQTYIHQKYFDELVRGIFLTSTKSELLRIINRMKIEDKIEAVILGGTELPLLLHNEDDPDIPFLDTTKIHVEGLIEFIKKDF